jgi:hypothetical protein
MTRVEVYKSRRRSGCASILVGCLMIVALVFGLGALATGIVTALNIGQLDIEEASYNDALEGAESLQLTLRISVGDLTLESMTDSNELFTADIRYRGTVEVEISGEDQREIRLIQTDGEGFNLNFPEFFNTRNWNTEGTQLNWDVRVNTAVPLDLWLETGVGSADLDLRDFTLNNLSLGIGVGNVDVRLPEPSGELVVDIDGSVGDVDLEVPEEAAVRVEANTGVGGVDLPGAFVRMEGSEDDDFIGTEGAWETEGYDEAETRILIRFDGGVGELSIRD